MTARWLRRLAWLAGSIALLWALLWLAVPPLLKWQLQTRLSELLGRPFSVESVSFQPWTLDLTLRGIRVAAAAPGAEPQLELGRLRANLSAASLFRRAPVIEALELDTLRLRLARLSEGHYDVDDLIERFKPSPDATPPAEPARFALYNVEIRDAALRFDDRPVSRVHELKDLHLALPFLSNLPAQLEVTVRPRLAFKLNGAPFDSHAETTPFAADHETALKLKIDGLDVAPYLGYMPKALPVRLVRGVLASDLTLQFKQDPNAAPTVALAGTVGARDLALHDADNQQLLAWRQLQIGLRDAQPLAHKLAFDSLRLDGAQLQLSRDGAGALSLLKLKKPATATEAAASAASAASTSTNGTAAATPWQLSLASLELSDSQLLWNDAAVKPAAALALDGLSLQAKELQWPAAAPMPLSLQATLRSQDDRSRSAGQLAIQGNASDREAAVTLNLTDLSLEALAPYVAQALTTRVQGRLSAQAQLDWAAGGGSPGSSSPKGGGSDTPAAGRLKLTLAQATLDDLRLVPTVGRSAVATARDGATLAQLALVNVLVDVPARDVKLGSVTLNRPVVALARNEQRQHSVLQWLRAGDETPAAPSPGRNTAAAEAAPPWRVQVDQLALDGGQLSFIDEAARHGGQPTRIEFNAIRLGVQQLVWQGEREVPPAKVQLSARVGGSSPDTGAKARGGLAGTLDWKGELGLQPLQARGQLRAARVPVSPFVAYFADKLPVALLRAEAGYTGQVVARRSANGFDAEASGDVLLGDVHVSTLPDANRELSETEELLNWQLLALKRLEFKMKPEGKPQLDIGEVTLNDFYSRLVVTADGRFNLQDVRPPTAAASAMAAASAPAQAPASAPVPTMQRTADEGLPLDVRIGGIQLGNGRVDFTDNFVQPNYSAELSELNGQLGAFSSASRDMANVQLTGRVAGTGRLAISGQVNPTVKPLALDMKASAADIELSPLSPYAGKYAGYGIERGKLSVNVAYKIDADGRLEANNQLVLNQLTFGEKIDSPSATKLPVQLAVALLKDRHGVIDINLPVSGSLNDPEFSIGGIIVKLIVNLLVKAITAPFALLAGGGGEELNQVDFVPGTATLAVTSKPALDKVAKALVDRPTLQLTIVGTADLATEADAWRRATLDARLLAERRKELLREGANPEAPVTMTADDRARLLKALYRQTDMPGKPRNALGLVKDIPDAQMEALLLQQQPATADAMRELAQQRGLVVRDSLVDAGLPSERLFLGAPKAVSGAAAPGGAASAPASGEAAPGPRALLSLAVR